MLANDRTLSDWAAPIGLVDKGRSSTGYIVLRLCQAQGELGNEQATRPHEKQTVRVFHERRATTKLSMLHRSSCGSPRSVSSGAVPLARGDT